MTVPEFNDRKEWQLLTLITNNKSRDLVEDCLEEMGNPGYFCMYAKGTSRPSLMKSLGLIDDKRLYYMIPLAIDEAEKSLNYLNEKMKLHKAGTGMTFRHPLPVLLNDKECVSPEKLAQLISPALEDKEMKNMYKKISVIMDLGRSEAVMEAARAAGARGGTVLRGHGSVGEAAGKLFGIRIVPEKELLLIIASTSDTPNIVKAIAEELNLDEAGNGILYIEDITDAGGLVK